MLDYFVYKREIKQVRAICRLLNDVKRRLVEENFEEVGEAYKQALPLFAEIKKIGIDNHDEKLANSQVVFKLYFRLFTSMLSYFNLLKRGKYKESWNVLQDCLDCAISVGKYTEPQKRWDVPEIISLLSNYEKLYPYSVFASSEYVISRSHCSICGQSMQSLACQHRKGEIYWGEIAVEVIDKIQTIQAVCLVSHPEDKRCVLEMGDDNRSEIEKFKKLHDFVNLGLPYLMSVEVEQIIEKRKKEIETVHRNSRCLCGSGRKFKHCCGKELYYDFERNIIKPLGKIELYIV